MTDQTQTTTEPVLLPCPFCGGEPDRLAAMGESWVRCMTCNAATEMFGTDTAAIAAWNRRPAPAKPAEVPFAAEDACLACNPPAPFDWTVVGPKLVEALEKSLSALQRLHTDVEALIADSHGVYGLHGNGDPAPWEELSEGGQFEDWIGIPLWSARNAWHDGQAALAAAPRNPMENEMTDTTGVTDRFLLWLEHEIDEASMDIGAAHQEGGAATEAEKERASCLGFVRERYLALAAQPSAGAQREAVGLLRRWRAVVAPSEALEDITDAFLATQKAEGAET